MENAPQSTPATTSVSKPSRMRRWFPTPFAVWSFRKRAFRMGLFLFACLATLLLIFHAEEDLRGKLAWNKVERELKAKGGLKDLAQYIPPPVPDDQNFAMCKPLAPVFDFLPGTQLRRMTNADDTQRVLPLMDWKATGLTNSGWQMGERVNLMAVAEAFRKREQALRQPLTPANAPQTVAEAASGILAALAQYEPALGELQEASRRPRSRFNIRYENEDKFSIILPHLGMLRWICWHFQDRACAELVLGQTDQAFRDTMTIFYIIDSVKDEPILISYLVRADMMGNALQPVWEGLADHRWSREQVEQLQARLQQFDYIKDGRLALGAERDVFGNWFFDYWRGSWARYDALESIIDLGSGSLPRWERFGRGALDTAMLVFIPRGWSYFEQANYCQAVEQDVLCRFDNPAKFFDPARSRQLDEDFLATRPTPVSLIWNHRVMASILVPGLLSVDAKAARAQTSVDLGTVACALEQYRIAHGDYPEQLAVMVPEFMPVLPVDRAGGQPLKYRTAPGGRFVLYSVGWDGKDDGGTPEPPQTKWANLHEQQPPSNPGDWVWSYPATAAK